MGARKLRRQRAQKNCGRPLCGRELERMIGKALQYLVSRGKIASAGLSQPNDKLDRAGIDAFFTRNDGEKVEFQIKCSIHGVLKHLRRYPKVLVMNFAGCTKLTTIEELAKRLIQHFEL